jgi:hypothetical protein
MIAEESLPTPRRGLLAIISGVILHPRRTFELLREQSGRAWLAAALLAMLFTILPVLVASPISTRKAQEVMRAQMESQAGQMQTLTPEQQQQAESTVANPLFTVVMPGLGGLAGLWIGWLVWAGSLHLLGTMLGGSNSFGQMWQVVVWSWLPYSLRGLLQTVFILLTGSLIEHPGLSGLVSGSSTASEMIAAPPSTGQMALQYLLGRVDLFLLWNLALLVTGVIAAGRLSRRKALLITLGVWVVLTLLGLIPVIVSGSFARGFSGG